MPVVFLHNPRTGGITLRRILQRQFPSSAQVSLRHTHYGVDDVARLLPGDLGGIELVQGHIPYGSGALLGPDATTVTWLREPIGRIVSMYRYRLWKSRENGVPPMSLRRFLASGKVRDVDNGQTRRLAGVDPPFGRCTPDLLALATRHLDAPGTLFGLTDRFDESLVLLRRRLGWRETFYSRENALPVDAAFSLSEDDLDAIREWNRLDLELYEYAQARSSEIVARQGVDFRLEVGAFRRLNRLYGAARWRYKRLRRRVRAEQPEGRLSSPAPTAPPSRCCVRPAVPR